MNTAVKNIGTNLLSREGIPGFSGYRFPILGALALLLSLPFLAGYVNPGLNLWLAVLALPLSLRLDPIKKSSFRLGILAMIVLGLYFFVRIKLVFLTALLLFIFHCFENYKGRINLLTLSLIPFFSPVPHYIESAIGFNLRMWLSGMAGEALNLLGMQVNVNGNIFMMNGEEFVVDPACSGIKMLLTAWIVFVMLAGMNEKRQQKRGSFLAMAGLGALGIALVLLANFFRIIGIVLGGAGEGTFLHEIIGILAFVIYFLLPMYFLVAFVIKKTGRSLDPKPKKTSPHSSKTVFLFSLVLFIPIAFCGLNPEKTSRIDQPESLYPIEIAGFDPCITENNILALSNAETMVYIKPPSPFYAADHNPEICWRGAGFTMLDHAEREIDGQMVRTARLRKNGEVLYTAWWYDNGNSMCSGPLAWRWAQINGEKAFHLLNVTTVSPEKLENECRKLMNDSPVG